MKDDKRRVCPVERAGHLDSRIRRWFQNPQKILRPFIKEGMTVLDLGCGPGFFTLDMAHMAGETGLVIASDLQEGMLEKLKYKIHGTLFENRIIPHQCQESQIGLTEKVDFILAFYMVHEVSRKDVFFNELFSILKSDSRVLIVEPSFHVSKRNFDKTIQIAQNSGFTPMETPKVFFSRSVVLKKFS